jgi:hypothetical protein
MTKPTNLTTNSSKRVESEILRKAEKPRPPEKSIINETFGIWRDWKISGEEYVRQIRRESEGRLKRLGL